MRSKLNEAVADFAAAIVGLVVSTPLEEIIALKTSQPKRGRPAGSKNKKAKPAPKPKKKAAKAKRRAKKPAAPAPEVQTFAVENVSEQ